MNTEQLIDHIRPHLFDGWAWRKVSSPYESGVRYAAPVSEYTAAHEVKEINLRSVSWLTDEGFYDMGMAILWDRKTVFYRGGARYRRMPRHDIADLNIATARAFMLLSAWSPRGVAISWQYDLEGLFEVQTTLYAHPEYATACTFRFDIADMPNMVYFGDRIADYTLGSRRRVIDDNPTPVYVTPSNQRDNLSPDNSPMLGGDRRE